MATSPSVLTRADRVSSNAGDRSSGSFSPLNRALLVTRSILGGVQDGGRQILAGGCPGVLRANRTNLLHDDHGQILAGFSISAGLGHPGIGPELPSDNAFCMNMFGRGDTDIFAVVRHPSFSLSGPEARSME